MKKRPLLIIILAISLMILCACGGSSPATDPTTMSETSPAPTDAPAAPVYVYENALEDYLLPLENFSSERTSDPEFVMSHFTSAVVNHRDDPYNIQYVREIFVDYGVSVHYIIERDGTVRCYIPEDRVAWHAGKGEFANDPKYTNKMNQYAIGIEVLAIGSQEDMSIYLTEKEYQGLDDAFKGYTQAQYDALQLLVADLCSRYDIPMDRSHVIGHEEYSASKTDPGELFDWGKIIP